MGTIKAWEFLVVLLGGVLVVVWVVVPVATGLRLIWDYFHERSDKVERG